MGFLNGIRVVSFTTSVAGPNAARLLAQCGAEVIKIESKHGGMDGFRYFKAGGDPDIAPRFIESNLNVLSALINLKDPTGVRLTKELIAKSDVVLDNFRPDVMNRLGLGPEELLKMKPELIVARMPGLGLSGPKYWYGSFGSTLTAFSGITYLWNHPGQPRPIGAQVVYPDYVAAALMPASVIAALIRRRKTGKGAILELAQAEATAYVLGGSLLEAAVNNREPAPLGNDWPYAAPHNCYPCLGDDRWCVIAVETDEQWRALAGFLEQPDLAHDARYATLLARRRNRAELDQLISGWTSQHEAHSIMHQLQQAGVPCGVVQSGEDLFHDLHLRERGFISGVEHPTLGHIPLPTVPVHMEDGAIDPPRCSDMLGAHTEYVVCDLLGYGREQ
ncbi:MAG TPA: CoA transferase, partial [Chloroflexota bacterium]|nr:CoA transferase [Chloroflexota bacterium]